MGMEVIVERCAFLDVHRDTVMACARTPDGVGGRCEDVSEFGTTTSQLLALVSIPRFSGRGGCGDHATRLVS